MRKPRQKLDAAAYARVFEGNPEGALVLEELVAMFSAPALFVKGGEDGRRSTDYRLGQHSVPNYIINQINRANLGEDHDQSDDTPEAG